VPTPITTTRAQLAPTDEAVIAFAVALSKPPPADGRLPSPRLRGAAVLDAPPGNDTGQLELLPYLEPVWRAEVSHVVLHLGLIGAVRRLAPGRR
jgi:hypothetical protein